MPDQSHLFQIAWKLNTVVNGVFLKLAIAIAPLTKTILYGSLRLSICNCGFDYLLESLSLKRCSQWLRGGT